MSTSNASAENIYHNAVTGAVANRAMPNPNAIDDDFVQEANGILQHAAELARSLIGAHQSAIAIIVENDWTSVRKYFSLSSKYAQWADYATPATGYGIHEWLIRHNKPIRMTQAELEAHPEWKNFGTEAGKHPPMRGWLATPIVDRDGVNWGIFQLSDKVAGEFTAEDERLFFGLAELVASALEGWWQVRNLRQGSSQG
jgi:GAF domain-containing protein